MWSETRRENWQEIYILLEYLGFGFLSLVDFLSGLGSIEDSSTVSDVTGTNCSATGGSGAASVSKDSTIGDLGVVSGVKELVGLEVSLSFQA